MRKGCSLILLLDMPLQTILHTMGHTLLMDILIPHKAIHMVDTRQLGTLHMVDIRQLGTLIRVDTHQLDTLIRVDITQQVILVHRLTIQDMEPVMGE